MSFVKITAIICVILAVSFISYLLIKGSLNPVENLSVTEKNDDVGVLSFPKLDFTSPFELVNNKLQDFGYVIANEDSGNQFSDEKNAGSTPSTAYADEDIFKKISEELNNFKNKAFPAFALNSDVLQVSLSELKIQGDGIKSKEDYYKKFLEIAVKNSFTEGELALIQKDSDGMALLLENLIEKAVSGENLGNLKNSFLAWHRLDEAMISDLKNIPITGDAIYLQQMMIGWYKYHSQTAAKFEKENLSANDASQIANDFKKNADIFVNNFKKSVAGLEKTSSFSLISKAEAFTCAAFVPPPFYHFGGRVIVPKLCNFGLVVSISPPCGGEIFFSWPVLAANPYLWKKPTPAAAILGRSVIAPGICPLGPCPKCIPFPYEAVALYFGTSLIP